MARPPSLLTAAHIPTPSSSLPAPLLPRGILDNRSRTLGQRRVPPSANRPAVSKRRVVYFATRAERPAPTRASSGDI
ncbi:unnamed protein product [Peniophora sp. CBMAI 1063]|nr:unnamed protein product [Peniophora sp. CBMAI 1063]